MSCIFVTGSADGLGRAAAETLMGAGHRVILHARSKARAAVLASITGNLTDIVIGDLASAGQTRSIADQVNAFGGADAVIHNAGVYQQASRNPTPEGHPTMLAVNVLAPYILTALIGRPTRLIYLSSGMHRDAGTSLDDIEWKRRAWSAVRLFPRASFMLQPSLQQSRDIGLASSAARLIQAGFRRRWAEQGRLAISRMAIARRYGCPSATTQRPT